MYIWCQIDVKLMSSWCQIDVYLMSNWCLFDVNLMYLYLYLLIYWYRIQVPVHNCLNFFMSSHPLKKLNGKNVFWTTIKFFEVQMKTNFKNWIILLLPKNMNILIKTFETSSGVIMNLFNINVLMLNWRHIWCQTVDVNVLMLNWRHIWCQTVDVNLMSIFGKKSFLRSMFWCEIDVIFDVKLLMSMFWCWIDVIFDVKLLMSIWCQFLVKNLFQGQCLDVKLTSYLMSNYWCNVLMLNWRHIWCQTVDNNLMSIFGQKSFSRSMFWCEIDVIFDVKLLMSMFWC